MNYLYEIDTPNAYKTAHLSQIDFPLEYQSKINDWLKKKRGILLLCGSVGVGKTHFCWAFHHHVVTNIRHYEEVNFYSDVRNAMKMGYEYQSEINRWCETPYFVIDDVGATEGTDFQKGAFYTFVNARMKNTYPTVIATNLRLKDFKDRYGERVESRLSDANNVILDIVGPDRRLKKR